MRRELTLREYELLYVLRKTLEAEGLDHGTPEGNERTQELIEEAEDYARKRYAAGYKLKATA